VKLTRRGITYDTEADEELTDSIDLHPNIPEDNPGRHCLRRTPTGHYYVRTFISQCYVDGSWIRYNSFKELAGYGLSLSLDRPYPRTRCLETVTPITRAEAYRLAIQSVQLPEEFQSIALSAFPGLTAQKGAK
jgi:hypothetical protein